MDNSMNICGWSRKWSGCDLYGVRYWLEFWILGYGRDDLFCRIREVRGCLECGHLGLGVGEDFSGFFHVCAFEADDDRDFEGEFLAGLDEGFSDEVALGDAAEDVDENSFDVWVGEDDAEGFDGSGGGGGAAY